jgi:hypothetical protein
MDERAYLVVITSFDPTRKIQAIMRIREVTGVGIGEAKRILENNPSILMYGMFRTQAEQLSHLLEEMGMVIDIQVDESTKPSQKNLDQLRFTPDPNKPVVIQKFVYEFVDDPRGGDLSIDPHCPSDAYIKFNICNGKDFWLSANRAGWLHLAKVCCEIGMQSQLESGYHVHISDVITTEPDDSKVTFELSSDIA